MSSYLWGRPRQGERPPQVAAVRAAAPIDMKVQTGVPDSTYSAR